MKIVSKCEKYLTKYPRSYTMRCILAYTYRFLNNYEKARLCLLEAIQIKEKDSIAHYILGEISFRQQGYKLAIFDLSLVTKKLTINNAFIILANSYLLEAEKNQDLKECLSCYNNALDNYKIALKNN